MEKQLLKVRMKYLIYKVQFSLFEDVQDSYCCRMLEILFLDWTVGG